MACFWNKLHQVRKIIKGLQSQIIFKVLGAIKQKEPKQDSQNWLRLRET